MAKSLNELIQKIDPEVQVSARAKAVNILTEMSLAEMRKLRGTNQIELAELMNIAQSNISQIENRPDALVSTLSLYIEALGGEVGTSCKISRWTGCRNFSVCFYE